jgi:hypothetical protein
MWGLTGAQAEAVARWAAAALVKAAIEGGRIEPSG